MIIFDLKCFKNTVRLIVLCFFCGIFDLYAMSQVNIGDVTCAQTSYNMNLSNTIVGSFNVQICNNEKAVRNYNGDIEITIKLTQIDNTGGYTHVYINDPQEKVSIIYDGEKYNSDYIVVRIPRSHYQYNRHNEILTLPYQFKFFKDGDVNNTPISDLVNIVMTPIVSLTATETSIDLGTLQMQNNRLTSVGDHYLMINYTIMTDAKCNITSQNDFRLRHPNNCFIPYNIRCISGNNISSISSNIKQLDLPATQDNQKLAIDVSHMLSAIPLAPGKYTDTITITIIPHS